MDMDPQYPGRWVLSFFIGWTPLALLFAGVLPEKPWIGIVAYCLAMPITMFPIYGLIYGLLVGVPLVVGKFVRGEALWMGTKQVQAWHVDWLSAYRAGETNLPDVDDYCLRKRVWRRLRR
jgi:hypothetical protein